MKMADRKSTHVVMLAATHDTAADEVVAVTPEQAERLVRLGHARAPRSGEVKAAEGK